MGLAGRVTTWPAGGPLVALAGCGLVVVGWPAGGPLEGNVRQKKSPAVGGVVGGGG